MRVALVTGSSRGLGRAIAERLARDGLAVAVNDRRGEGEPVAAAIRRGGSACAAFAADVTDAQAVTGLVDAIERRLAPVDVLVLNATGPQPDAPLAALGWREHLDQLEFFVKSPVLLGRAVLPGMRERGWGRIVQVDSEVVDRPPPGRSAYAVAKAAQIGLTRAWARELAVDGTRSRRASCRWSDTPTCVTWSATPTSLRGVAPFRGRRAPESAPPQASQWGGAAGMRTQPSKAT